MASRVRDTPPETGPVASRDAGRTDRLLGGDVMDDRTDRLESAVEQLRLAVLSLERRLDLLEARRTGGAASVADARAEGRAGARAEPLPDESTEKDPYDPIAILSLVGRLLLVLAGGYFLRAMTDAGALNPPLGLILAAAYAVVWLFLADRAGGRSQLPSAVFHALAAAMIAFPLLIEATIRFKVLTSVTSAVALAVLTAALLLVAWRRRLRAVAWINVIGALVTSVVLLAQTAVFVPLAFYLIAFGVATYWWGDALGWPELRWPVALAANLAVAGVTLRAAATAHLDAPQAAMLLQALLLGAYVASIAIRTLVRGGKVTPFECVQSATALVVGLGGAIYLTRATGTVPAALGVTSLVFGAACYGAVIASVHGLGPRERNVHFYATLALVLMLAGLTLVLGGPWPGAVFAALAVLAAGLWSRFGRRFMLLHSAVYVVAAGIVSGTLSYCVWGLGLDAAGPWARPDVVMLAVLVAATLSAWLAATRPAPEGGVLTSVPRLVLILVLVVAAGGCVIGYVAPATAGLDDGSVDPGVLATVRTCVLAVAALLIAWIGRHNRFREWGWLVYPLLAGIALKMVAHDFQYSRPATLFIAMALYGAALIVAPRLRRRTDTAVASGNL